MQVTQTISQHNRTVKNTAELAVALKAANRSGMLEANINCVEMALVVHWRITVLRSLWERQRLIIIAVRLKVGDGAAPEVLIQDGPEK